MNNTVSIIVPIYNAYHDTKKCLESLLLNTDDKHQILLMDDSSTDRRIINFIHELSSQYSHISFIRNSQNVGFVKNCNIGFRESDQLTDVVILNSDTIVTPNWLEKLVFAAYSSHYVATVTPLTNNGTICSVPNWLESNEIPDGHTILSFASLIEKTSLRKYPRIPTAVGFCTYIKREVLNNIGLFDEINFYRGYGEENDFCCRASETGYFHIVDDATFVYHAGSKSFKSDKQKLIEDNSKILAKLHPRYFPEVYSFIESNPLNDILDNIKLHLEIEKLKKLSPICFILHNSVDTAVNQPLGGTEYHCAALISNLSQNRPIYNIFYNKYANLLELEIFYKQQKLNFKFPCEFQRPYGNNYFNHSSHFLQLLVGIFSYFQPTLLHIHHIKGLPIADVVSAIKQVNIPYFISLHDYYLICPSYNLIDYKENFCYEHKTREYCQTCVQSLFNEGKELRHQWQHYCQKLLEGAVNIIAPSKTALSYFQREYNHLKLDGCKFKVIKHGILTESDIDKKNKKLFISQTDLSIGSPIKVALVGSINIAKGSKIFIQLLDKISQDQKLNKEFHFEIIGRFNLNIPKHIQNVTIRSEYSRKDLAVLLEQIDIAIFPNIWAETYCLTVDEVIAHCIPVVTTPLSAASERVKEFEVGWVSKSASADNLLETLIDIKSNHQEYIKIKKNTKNYPLLSYEKMAQQYLELYLTNKTVRETLELEQFISAKKISKAYFYSNASLSLTEEQQVKLQKLNLMINAMESSKFWKLRVAWLRLKKALGIIIDDDWMKERGGVFK
ncbi:glycosyltransferase [Calothrix sp. CCY 0018]|uniref:glycosyltransferase n=1 Tax=Calothrix sp. CCY 0018 TaxID=3103864 RepID=UPI0039C69961